MSPPEPEPNKVGVNFARDANKITLLSTAMVKAVNPINHRSKVVRILLLKIKVSNEDKDYTS